MVGLIILAMGGMLLLDRLSAGHLRDARVVALRADRHGRGAAWSNAPGATGRERGERRSGVWLIVVGLWGLVNEWRLFGLSYGTSWPLLVMASGAMMVWRSLEARTRATSRREP